MSVQIVSILILILVIVLFISQRIPSPVTAVLGCALYALFNACTVQEAFSGFSNSVVILAFGMMVLGSALSETGLAELIGREVTRLAKHNEMLFIVISATAAAVLSAFLANIAVIAIFLVLTAEISKSDPVMNRMNITYPIALGSIFGGSSTLVGSTTQLIGNGILSETGVEGLKMFDYTLPGVILFAVLMAYIVFVGYPLGKKIWGNREPIDSGNSETQVRKISDSKAQKGKMRVVALIFAATIVSFTGGWIDASLTAILAAILCMLTGCVSFHAMVKKMDWSVLFVLAGCLGLAAGIIKGGVAELLSGMISNTIGNNVPPLLVFSFFLIVTMIFSNFVMNATAATVILPIALSFCVRQGLNPALFTMGIVFAANLSFTTPLANAFIAMILGAGYRFTDCLRYTWLLDILTLLTMIVVFPLLMPLTIQ